MEENKYIGFWERVQLLRKAQGITFVELATYTDMNHNVLKSSLSKCSRPSVSNALGLARGLNSTVEYLMTGEIKGQGGLPNDVVEVAMLYNNLTPENKEYIRKTLTMLTTSKN